MKIKVLLPLLFITIAISSCKVVKDNIFHVGQKRAERNLFVKYPKKYPELFQKRITVKDSTFRFEFKLERTTVDTLIPVSKITDTIYIEKDRLKVRIIPQRNEANEIINLQVDAQCDTVYIYEERIVEIPTISDVITEQVFVKYVPWWMWLIISLLVLFFLAPMIREITGAIKR